MHGAVDMRLKWLSRQIWILPLRLAHELFVLRLRAETWRATRGKTSPPPRVVATACWTFPIYSQTFVHQEVAALARAGFSVRLLYSRLGPRDELADACIDLWPLKRRVLLHAEVGAWDLAHFRRRMPAKVEALMDAIAATSGLPREELEQHEHVLQAFSFARAVEACRPDYLHSYFFYERTLFALVASHLLGVPRGVSCYADHMLQDYPLKVVPLHLQTCDVIVATSRRIRGELEALNGRPLPAILVKPNAIDTSSFPVSERRRAADAPLRLVCVSRIDPKKGLEYLIDAVRLLQDRGLAVEAHILGAPNSHLPESLAYAEALHARVARLGLNGTVHFLGQRASRQVQAALQDAHVFVAPFVELPSGDKDGIPTAVLEAMAAGCVIVATTVGSIDEVIEDGREGLLVPQRDAAALAAAVERLAGDEALAARLRSSASIRARVAFDVGDSEIAFHSMVRSAIEARQTVPADTGGRR